MVIATLVRLCALMAVATIPVVYATMTISVLDQNRVACQSLQCPFYSVLQSFPEENFEIRELEASRWISTKVPFRSAIEMATAMRVGHERLTSYLNGENTEGIVIQLQSPIVHHLHTECYTTCRPVLTTSMFIPTGAALPLPARDVVFLTDMPRTEIAVLAFSGHVAEFEYDLRPRLSQIVREALRKGINLQITNSNFLLVQYDHHLEGKRNELWVVPSELEVPLTRQSRVKMTKYIDGNIVTTKRFSGRVLTTHKREMPHLTDAGVRVVDETLPFSEGIVDYPMTVRKVEGKNTTVRRLRARITTEHPRSQTLVNVGSHLAPEGDFAFENLYGTPAIVDRVTPREYQVPLSAAMPIEMEVPRIIA